MSTVSNLYQREAMDSKQFITVMVFIICGIITACLMQKNISIKTQFVLHLCPNRL